MNQADSIVGRQAEPCGFTMLVQAFRIALRCNSAWEIAPDGVLSAAGARNAEGKIVKLRREPLRREFVYESIEVAVPRLRSPWSVYDLFEDHLAVRTRERQQPQAIPWPELHVAAGDIQFIEEADVPADAEDVPRIPDSGAQRRRRRDPKPPVVRYGSLTLTGSDGFRSVWHFSRVEAAVEMSEGMVAVGAKRR